MGSNRGPDACYPFARWTTLRRLGRFDGRVEWLDNVIRAVYGRSVLPDRL